MGRDVRKTNGWSEEEEDVREAGMRRQMVPVGGRE